MRWHWIDRFTEFRSGVEAKAVKMVSAAEEHLRDHFPGFPLMPNSLVLEGLAQTSGLLVCEYFQCQRMIVLARIHTAQFHFDAAPGDFLTYTATIDYVEDDGSMARATSHRGQQLQAEAEFVFAHFDSRAGNGAAQGLPGLVELMRLAGVYEVGTTADGKPIASNC